MTNFQRVVFSFVSQKWVLLTSLSFLFFAPLAWAMGNGQEAGHGAYAISFLGVALILIAAKSASLVEKNWPARGAR